MLPSERITWDIKRINKNTTVGCITYELAKSSVTLCVKNNTVQQLFVIKQVNLIIWHANLFVLWDNRWGYVAKMKEFVCFFTLLTTSNFSQLFLPGCPFPFSPQPLLLKTVSQIWWIVFTHVVHETMATC